MTSTEARTEARSASRALPGAVLAMAFRSFGVLAVLAVPVVSGLGSVPELSFWTAREFWGQGITTSAVDAFLASFAERPVRAHVPADNVGSQKILTRRGFAVVGEDKTFSNARSEVVTELIMQLG